MRFIKYEDIDTRAGKFICMFNMPDLYFWGPQLPKPSHILQNYGFQGGLKTNLNKLV